MHEFDPLKYSTLKPSVGINEIEGQKQLFCTINAKEALNDKKLAQFAADLSRMLTQYGYFHEGTLSRKFVQNLPEYSVPEVKEQ